MRNFLKHLTVYLLVVTVGFGCQSIGTQKGAPSSSELQNLTRIEKREVELGRQIHDEILSSFYLYTEPRLNAYIADVGSRLAQVSERNRFPYRFTVLADSKIYATSAPGGFIYVTTGFLNFLENEAELAAVLGHEIGQLQYKDPRLSPFKKTVHILDFLVTSFGGIFGPMGLIAIVGVKCLNVLTEAKGKDSRAISADSKALEYLVKARYDPQGLWDVLERIGYLNGAELFRAFDYQQTRPLTERRFRRLARRIKKLDLSGLSFDNRRDRFQSEVKGVHEIYRIPASVQEQIPGR